MFKKVAFIALAVSAIAASASASDLPRFNEGEPFAVARTRIIKAGFVPFPMRAKADNEKCAKYCAVYPEVIMCVKEIGNYCRFSYIKPTADGPVILVLATEGTDPKIVDAGEIEEEEVDALIARRERFEGK